MIETERLRIYPADRSQMETAAALIKITGKLNRRMNNHMISDGLRLFRSGVNVMRELFTRLICIFTLYEKKRNIMNSFSDS